jgi:hypothetical protein
MSKAKAAALATVFMPLTKVDEEQRLVYGRITQEELDKSGEVMDYDTSKPFFEKWSQNIEEASGGLSKGNVRVMHQAQVAGKLTDIQFNDDEKAIDVCSKIVDDNEWQKVLEGCYTGFSVGGKYAKRWNVKEGDKTIKKYTADPSEVSIVDNPCVTSATFMLTKADGTEQEIMFKSVQTETSEQTTEETTEETVTETVSDYQPSNDDIAAKAAEIAGPGGNWTEHVEAAREQLIKAHSEANDDATNEEGGNETDTSATADEDAGAEASEKVTPAGVKQVWQASDGKTFEKKDECVGHEATLNPEETQVEDPSAKALRDALGKVADAVSGAEQARGISPDEGDEDTDEPSELVITDFERVAKAVAHIEEQSDDTLQKSIYTVSRFASVVSDVAYLVSSIKCCSDKGSELPEEVKTAAAQLAKTFETFATQQVARLIANLSEDEVSTFCCAAGVDGADGLTKDVATLIELTKDEATAERERLSKFAEGLGGISGGEADDEGADLTKRAETAEAERDSLRKVVEEVTPQLETLTKRLETLENTPLPRAPRNVLEKNGSDGAAPTREELVQTLGKMVTELGSDAVATMLIKASQTQPQKLGGAPR